MKGSTTGSLRYDMTGRKRKSKALNKCKRYKPAFKEMTVKSVHPAYEDQVKYSSAPLTPASESNNVDDSYKQEVSKKYTVSIAYNKGSYQVVPNDDVKHIGRS
jgi:hypothetical protein